MMNGMLYRKILTENLFENANSIMGRRWVFQQDNDPKPTSRDVKSDLETHLPGQVLPWPSYSPDLNPIENLWQDLKRRLRLNHFKSKNKQELFHLLQEEWFNTNPKTINKLIDSMPRRIDAVIKSRGNPSRY